MPEKRDEAARRSSDGGRRLKLAVILLFALLAVGYRGASTQNPVFDINIDQQKLLSNGYTHAEVIQAGGQFWTTPFTKYDPKTKSGDGYGEGDVPGAPRYKQRVAFNPRGFPPVGIGGGLTYPFLRLNGLDSQSCYECHNSIGSDPGYGADTALIRKQPSSVGGSAGSNSNAFINPCFPQPLTLFIRQPPHVYGSGYVQSVGDEVTGALYELRKQARVQAKQQPGRAVTVRLLDTKHNLDYGVLKTTYTGRKWALVNNRSGCPSDPCPGPAVENTAQPVRHALSTPAVTDAEASCIDYGAVVVNGFTDDVGLVKGISSDLVIRPFQWKGVASSLRHFVRDALDFHFSMQAVEKVGDQDCDMDQKTDEVMVGNVSAITAFVGMTRPPQQVIPAGVSPDSVLRGYQIFTGTASNVKPPPAAAKMCATCHMPSLPLREPNPQFIIDSPVVSANPTCPTEATGSYNSLISPLRSHLELPVLRRLSAESRTGGNCPAPDQTYNIPLNSTDVPPASLPRLTQTAPFFLSNLPPPPADGFYVPFFSDLHTHDMGAALADITAQGSDINGVCIQPRMFLTRPLWGVADTGPWLHDGRATSLMQAILLHGDSTAPLSSRSEAAPIIDFFEKLSADDKQAVVNFLLSLRLPLEQPQGQTARR